jgi:transcriptional regulator with XRE-family HTH domain
MQGQIVTQVLRQRIGERIGSLKISWRQASIDAGLGSGFIQDLITGRAKDPPEEAITRLAAALKCSPAYLLGRDEEASQVPQQPAPYTSQRPDAVMTLKIVEELLTGGHIESARLAVKRALKEIESEQTAPH